MDHQYQFQEAADTITPALILYRDILRQNIEKAVHEAGDAGRLWPHVKTHKMAEMVRLQMNHGIKRFKCATIAEAEMAAGCGAGDVLVAYPLVGPNIGRFLCLAEAFPDTRFWAIGDDWGQLELLGRAALERRRTVPVLVDVNMGMDRTGVSFDELEDFYIKCREIPGLEMRGFHCYDGHRTERSYQERRAETEKSALAIKQAFASLKEKGHTADTVILGGTPSFPCYLDFESAYLSPGTLFIQDSGYREKYPDMDYTPGAAVLTRVVSCPKRGHFTLDLGYKGIASDPEGTRGRLVGAKHVRELFQSEEHWAFCMEEGHEGECPKVGDLFYVIPTHICPTSALYPCATVVEGGKAVAYWKTTARNRKIIY